MRVKYLIEQLKEYDPDDEIIVAYWDKDHIRDGLNRDIDGKLWAEIVDRCDDAIGYLDWADTIREIAVETLDKVAADDIA